MIFIKNEVEELKRRRLRSVEMNEWIRPLKLVVYIYTPVARNACTAKLKSKHPIVQVFQLQFALYKYAINTSYF